MTLTPKTTGVIAALGVFTIGILFMSVTNMFAKSPEELRMEAAQARIEAMQSDCETISDRVTSCFTDTDKSSCGQMQESYAWFQSEYGESPDFACSTVPDPLAFGAVNK